MKKLVLFVAVVAAASFASCKKDHTCTCNWTSSSTSTATPTGGGTSTTTTSSDSGTDVLVYTESKKGDARAACLSYTTEDSDTDVYSGYTVTTSSTYEADCSISK